MQPPLGAMLISITDPEAPDALLKAGWAQLLRLRFHDADPVTFPGTNPGLSPMSFAQAVQLASFLREHRSKNNRIVIHCKSGISRSAGAAKAVASWLGARFPPEYQEYNRHVHLLVSRALEQNEA